VKGLEGRALRFVPTGRPQNAHAPVLARAELHPILAQLVDGRDVQPHELRARFRPPGRTGSAPDCMARTMAARETIEASGWLRRAKAVLNALLAATGTGDTLRVLAERPS